MKDRVPNKKALVHWPAPCSVTGTALLAVDGACDHVRGARGLTEWDAAVAAPRPSRGFGRGMGFYVDCGSEGDGVLLREVGTREVVSSAVPAGYAGGEGQVWFVRVVPPPHELCRRHIVFNTPYVIREHPEEAFVEYLGHARG